jgi:multiple sugar transport system permease protein
MSEKKSSGSKVLNKALIGYSFLAPNIIGFLAFTLLPVFASLCLAFCDWDILTPIKFAGLGNFSALLKDRDFWYYLYNTFFFMLGIPVSMALSLAMALMLNQKLKGIIFFRTVFFMPVISSMVAVALVWRWIYNADFGLLNAFLHWIGIRITPQWLSSTFWAKPAIMFMTIWQGAGYNMLLYLAALQGIPEELYEAASIDGASPWESFAHVTWPMLRFVNFFIIIMSIIGAFQAFGVQYVMTDGGPAGATTTIVYYIYNNAFRWFKMGYASAIAWVLFLMMFFATLMQWRSMEKKTHIFYQCSGRNGNLAQISELEQSKRLRRRKERMKNLVLYSVLSLDRKSVV